MWKAPGFTLTVVLTLALGIGTATAIFSLIEGVLLRPLPFREPGRLMLIGDHLGGRDGIGVTAREIETYTTTTTAFASLGGYAGKDYETRDGGNTPEEIPGMRLTAGVFPTLGVEPLLGRVFTRAEEDGKRQVAVISYATWLNRFHRDATVLGRTINLDNRSYTVIGVMPRNFEFPVQVGRLNHTELWVPMSLTPDELAEAHEGVWAYQMVARLKDGVTVQQAASDVDRVAQVISRNFPPSMAAIKISGDAAPLRERVVGNVRPMLNVLLGAVGIVLLIACVNVAGLLLVRAIRRRHEYAVRLALGASAGRILRESVVEGTVLSVAGGLSGLALAAGIVRVALHLLPESMPRIDQIVIDGTVVGFALLLSVVTGVLCSLAPAFAATRTGVMENLKQSSHSSSGTGEPRVASLSPGSGRDRNRVGAADVFRSIPAELREDALHRSGVSAGACAGSWVSTANDTVFDVCFSGAFSSHGGGAIGRHTQNSSRRTHEQPAGIGFHRPGRIHDRRRTGGELEAHVCILWNGVGRLFPGDGDSAAGRKIFHARRPGEYASRRPCECDHGEALLAGQSAIGKRMHDGRSMDAKKSFTIKPGLQDV